ncbi:hypothetical protein BaRGS_00033871 [Batillaria attramentaria]|uniref:Uncharacterized protein n=1 Tax=Batillaria attramentaria TaxID=370345 RepID=A0ABD0JJ38_9CAEN
MTDLNGSGKNRQISIKHEAIIVPAHHQETTNDKTARDERENSRTKAKEEEHSPSIHPAQLCINSIMGEWCSINFAVMCDKTLHHWKPLMEL